MLSSDSLSVSSKSSFSSKSSDSKGNGTSWACLASVLRLMSLAACSLICKYVNFNLGIRHNKAARATEMKRSEGREEEGMGERGGKSVFLGR